MNGSYKKHQIFISSTYEDLKDERKAIFEAILEEGHIPAGMELFATSEKNQWSYITERIEDCDYYILIVAHRYGSVDDDGISFTEKEYQYALEKNIPIMAFIIDEKAPTDGTKYEKDTTKLNGLLKFKETIKSNAKFSTGGGTSDARFAVKYCKVVEFGLLARTAHKIDEYTEINDLQRLYNVYYNCLNKFLKRV